MTEKHKSTYPGHVVDEKSHGGNVKHVQVRLNQERAENPKDNKSQPLLAVDGDFGPKTKERVKQFQHHHKGPHGNPLDADGVVGKFTWAALFDEQLYTPPKHPHSSGVQAGTLILPYAHRVNYSDSGPYLSAPARGVIHTTEGHGLPNFGTGTAPQLSLDLDSGVVYQHMPLNRAGKALEHPAGTVDTNRLHAIQIECIGFAAHKASDWPDRYYEHLSKLMRDLELACGIHKTDHGLKWEAGWHGMSVDQWRSFNGWCGHQHVPVQFSHHWDPGAIDSKRLGL